MSQLSRARRVAAGLTPWLLLGCTAGARVPHPDATHGTPTDPTLPSVRATVEGPAPRRFAASDRSSVKLWLDSASATLSADGKLWLAARFTIPPGAHIYWSNPGESGLATRAEFSGPAEFTIGPTQYPGPRRFRGQRGASSYGYAGAAALLTEVLAKRTEDGTVATEATRPARFSVVARWLACSDVCVEESGEATLLWPPSRAEVTSPSVMDFVKSLPIRPTDSELTATWLSSSELELKGTPNTHLLEFFPDAKLGFDDRDCTHEPGHSPHVLRVRFNTRRTPERPQTGVVRALRDGRELFFSVVSP